MAKAKNIVKSGLYSNCKIVIKNFLRVEKGKSADLKYLRINLDSIDITKFIIINEQSISSIRIIHSDGITSDTNSSIARGIVGGMLLGSAGLIAGASIGEQNAINLLEIIWKDSQKSLIEVDNDILNMLNTIYWNIENNIDGDKLTNDEILKQIEKDNKITIGCFIFVVVWIILMIASFWIDYK